MFNKVLVCWDDTRSIDNWEDPDELVIETSKISSVGSIIGETDAVLCIAQSVDSTTDQVSGILCIPKCCITLRRNVKG